MTRRITHGDVVAAARVLIGRDEAAWAWCLCRMLREAQRADARRARTGRQHAVWGDGSLGAAALRRKPGREPPLTDAIYRRALVFVLERAFGAHPLAQDTQRVAVTSRSRRAGGMSSPQS